MSCQGRWRRIVIHADGKPVYNQKGWGRHIPTAQQILEALPR